MIPIDQATPPFDERPLVYVLGRSSGHPLDNLRDAVGMAEAFQHYYRCTAVVPSDYFGWDMISHHVEQHWAGHRRALLRRCDAVFCLEDADADDVRYAEYCGLPIFTRTHDLANWALWWEREGRYDRGRTLHEAADELQFGPSIPRPFLAERLRATAGPRPPVRTADPEDSWGVA